MTFGFQIKHLEADLEELGSLLEKAERKRVQELLKEEQKKVEKELTAKRQQKEQQARREADPTAAAKAKYTVKITNYGVLISQGVLVICAISLQLVCPKLYSPFFLLISGWDQSDKFVKIYLTLKDVHTIPSENVEVKFKERYADGKCVPLPALQTF